MSVLEVVFKRLEIFKEHLYIATTNDGSEFGITALCEKHGVPFYRGDTEDVLGRYYECARAFGAKKKDIIIRITSDCPFIDATLVQEGISRFQKEESLYYSNVIPVRTFPRGLDFEIFRFEALEYCYANATTSTEREHVTPCIIARAKEQNALGCLQDTEDYSEYRITLDTPEDYEVIRGLYEVLGCDTEFGYDVLKNALDSNKVLFEINKEIRQKTH